MNMYMGSVQGKVIRREKGLEDSTILNVLTYDQNIVPIVLEKPAYYTADPPGYKLEEEFEVNPVRDCEKDVFVFGNVIPMPYTGTGLCIIADFIKILQIAPICFERKRKIINKTILSKYIGRIYMTDNYINLIIRLDSGKNINVSHDKLSTYEPNLTRKILKPDNEIEVLGKTMYCNGSWNTNASEIVIKGKRYISNVP